MRSLDLALKDLKQILRDWKSALFLVIMPILFTVFFGLVFHPDDNAAAQTDPRLPVGFINQDAAGLLGTRLEALLPTSDVIRPVVLAGEQATERQAAESVAAAEFAAVISVPAGYSQALTAGQAASLDVIADQGTAAGRAAVTALETLTGRLLGAVETAHLSLEAYLAQASFPDEASRQAYFEAAFDEALAAWSDPPLTAAVAYATGAASVEGQAAAPSGFTQSSAGMIVQFAIFGLISSAMLLVLERKTGALPRLLTTSISRAEVIAGHLLAMFLVVFVQGTLLILLGQLVFGVDYLRQPGAVALMLVALAVWAASLGLLIGAMARKEQQVIVVCLIAMFLFSGMGGAWFPLEVTGSAFSAIGHLLPSAWAMDGFQNIIVRGLAFNSVLLPAGLLLAYAAAFFGLAVWRFKFE
jgi:ABC-2 type transport system permease protein